MHARKIAVLTAVFLVLGGLAVWLQGPGRRHKPGEAVTVFPSFDAAGAQGITVEGPGGSYALAREGEGWVVGEERNPADGDAVERFLEDLAVLEREAVASTSAEKHPLYGVDGERGTAVRVEGQGGDLLAAFTVGGQGPDPFSGYLVKEGDAQVLLVSSNLDALLGRGAEGWRERKIFTGDIAAVTAFSVRSEKGEVSLERRDDGTWTLEGRAVDPRSVEDYLDRLGRLRAAGFAGADEAVEDFYEDPFVEVTVMAGDETAALVVGALDEERGQRYLRSGDPPLHYLVSQYVAEDLSRGVADFPPPAAEGQGEEQK